jgi:hypothetical protein
MQEESTIFNQQETQIQNHRWLTVCTREAIATTAQVVTTPKTEPRALPSLPTADIYIDLQKTKGAVY